MEASKMDKAELIKIFSIFNVVYSKFLQVGKEELMVDVWYSMLSQYPYELVRYAAETHIKSSSFPPTIHDIIKHIREYEEMGKVDAMAAWGMVCKAIRQYGYYRQAEAMQSLPAEIQSVVTSMGWQTLCESENEIADRAHFTKAYEAMQKREKQIAMAGNLLHSMQEVNRLK